MRAVQARKIERVLARYASILKWEDWEFCVLTEPTKTALAETSVDFRRSSTAFCRDLFDYTPEAQRRIFCHELAHIFLHDLGDSHGHVKKALGKRAYSIFKSIVHDAEEKICEHFELVFAALVPLPEIQHGNKPMPPPTHEEDDE